MRAAQSAYQTTGDTGPVREEAAVQFGGVKFPGIRADFEKIPAGLIHKLENYRLPAMPFSAGTVKFFYERTKRMRQMFF